MTANAHPKTKIVELCDGDVKARIPKWTMAMRAEIKPRLVGLLQQVGVKAEDGTVVTGIAGLFQFAEDELVEICRACVKLPEGTGFDDLLWEDLPIMVQAIWEHNIVTDDGKGLAGKALSLLAPLMAKGAQQLAVEQALKANQHPKTSQQTDPSQSLKPSQLNSPASPSSPEGGEVTPTP